MVTLLTVDLFGFSSLAVTTQSVDALRVVGVCFTSLTIAASKPLPVPGVALAQ
jgi:hypothetical protein